MSNKRHKYRNGQATATFGELTYGEQSKSINMSKLNLKKMESAHIRKAREESEQGELQQDY